MQTIRQRARSAIGHAHVDPEGDISCGGFSPTQIPANTPTDIQLSIDWRVTTSDVQITREPVMRVQFVNQAGEIVALSEEIQFTMAGLSDSKTATVSGVSLPEGRYDVRTHHLRTSFPAISLGAQATAHSPRAFQAGVFTPGDSGFQPQGLGGSSCGQLVVGSPPTGGGDGGGGDTTNGGGGGGGGTNGGGGGAGGDGELVGGVSRQQGIALLLVAVGAAVAVGRR